MASRAFAVTDQQSLKASVRVNLPSEPVLAVAAREGSKSLAYVNGATPS